MSNITNNLLKLAISKKTVFTTADLGIFWGIEDKNVLKTTISRAIKKGYLKHLQRGLYTLNKEDINIFELAGKLKKNSYISFETVLLKNDVINQWYDTVFSASDRQVEIENEFGKFNYRKIPENILINRMGIINKETYFIASTERAICDYFYKEGFQQLDNTESVDKDRLLQISKIYNNKRLERDIKKLAKNLGNNKFNY